MTIDSSKHRLVAVSVISVGSLLVSLYAAGLALELLNSNQSSLADRVFRVSTCTFIIGVATPWIIPFSGNNMPNEQTSEQNLRLAKLFRTILSAIGGLVLGYLVLAQR